MATQDRDNHGRNGIADEKEYSKIKTIPKQSIHRVSIEYPDPTLGPKGPHDITGESAWAPVSRAETIETQCG